MSEPIDQLDPFKDDRSEFKTKEIRHSHSRKRSNPFIWLINPKDEKAKKRRTIFLTIVLLLIIAGSATFILLSSNNGKANNTPDDNPLVNPTGREASGEYSTDNLDDPELRESEHQKLATVIALTSKSDWDYARALFETIFPEYLDSCDKYDYYRVSLLLDDNLDDFEIARDRATERMQSHLSKCDRQKE